MLNILAGCAVVSLAVFLLSCLKAASDADDQMELLKYREDLKDDDHVG